MSLTTSTDAVGAFEFTRVPAGMVTVYANKDGYYDATTARQGLPMPGVRRRAAQPVAGGQVLEIAITLSRAGAIVGLVVDEFGDPAPSIAVEVLTRVSEARSSPWQNGGRRSESDDTGAFRVWGLAPGEYLVAARPRQVDVNGQASGSADREGYASTYYPGTASVVDAARVVVRAGRDTSGLTFPLLATRLAVIRGRVLSPVGAPAPKVTVMVSRVDRERLGTGATGASAGADGAFEVTRVPPGRYRLTAREGLDGPWGTLRLAGRVDVDVDGADVDGVTIPLRPGATARGRVVDEHGQPSGAALQVVFDSPDRSSGDVPVPQPVAIAADGTFTATGLFGPLYVGLRTAGPGSLPLQAAIAQAAQRGATAPLPPGVAAVRVGGVDMLDRAIPFDGQMVEMVVELTSQVSEVLGTVTRPALEREAGARRPVVVVFPDDADRWHPGALSIRAATVTPAGTFSIRFLPPGDRYLAIAVDGLAPGEHLEPAVLNALRPLARPLRVDAGGRHELSLSVTSWPLR